MIIYLHFLRNISERINTLKYNIKCFMIFTIDSYHCSKVLKFSDTYYVF